MCSRHVAATGDWEITPVKCILHLETNYDEITDYNLCPVKDQFSKLKCDIA